MMKFAKFILLLLIVNQAAEASYFKKIHVDGAKCGNGKAYSIFVKAKSKKKILFEFMGGGACWSRSTCYGPQLRAWIHRFPSLVTNFSVMSSDSHENPFRDYTKVYLPYCTGDLFLGNHVANYSGKKVYHYGRRNFKKVIDLLTLNKMIDFEGVSELVVGGSSAGALGALVHANTLSELMPNALRKTIIADSPGLHWKNNVWSQFSSEWIGDVFTSLDDLGISFDIDNQILAQLLPELCSLYSEFNIGFLQARKDIIMSRLFGKISPQEHERIIMSDIGLFSNIQRIKNCVSWLPDSYMHTFTLSFLTSRLMSTGITALDFIKEVHEGKQLTNY